MDIGLDSILIMVLPKSSIYHLVTEKTCFLCCRNLTFFCFFLLYHTVLERKYKFLLAWSPWVIFGPQTKLDLNLGLDPILMMVLSKKSKFHRHWSLWTNSILNCQHDLIALKQNKLFLLCQNLLAKCGYEVGLWILTLLLLVGIWLFNLFNSEVTIAFPAPGSYILYNT